ncbi:MAG: alpha/beta hydrolase [Pirellulaceae bacterium]
MFRIAPFVTATLVAVSLVAAVASPALAQRRAGAKGQAQLREKIAVQTDVEYAKAGDISLKLDIFQPKVASDQARPCIVWIHGGGWQGGNKSGGIGRLAGYVAGGDYVGVSVGYRLSGVATWPAQIHDCKAAIRYVRANASKLGIDPERIGVWGSSAGGHLVSLLGTSGDVKEVEGDLGTTGVSSRVACVVDYCGPSDFLAFGLGSPRMNQPGQPVFKLFGGPLKENDAQARQASPVTHVTKDDPPFLIVHGTADKTVPLRQAEILHAAQKAVGIDTTFVKIEEGGHGIGGPEIESRVRAFLDKHLLGKDVAVSAEPIVLKQ